MLDIPLVTEIEVVPRCIDKIPVIAYLYSIPRVTHNRARDKLSRYAYFVEEHCVQVSIALADRHAVFQHTVCGELLVVRTLGLAIEEWVVVIEV